MVTSSGHDCGLERIQNRILRRLPPHALERLVRSLQLVHLQPRQILHAARSPIEDVFFINRGWASLVIELEDGFQPEVSVVGREGIVGMQVFHGVETGTTEAVIRVPSEALRIRASSFRDQVKQCPELREELLRFSNAMCVQAEQIAACNCRHTLEKRLTRSLLMLCDRSDTLDLAVSQEVLATMLCVHRPSLTAAAGRLQRLGLIRHGAGHTKVLDRAGLEQIACECYETIRAS